MPISWLESVLIIYALFLSSLHILCKKISVCIRGTQVELLSFGGGALLAVVFLVLLPDVVHFSPRTYVYPLMLFGFVLFFLSEKYLYQHVKDEIVLEEEIYHLHVLGFFLDHFMKGFVLVTVVDLDPILGLLAAIPFLIHAISSTIALEQIHQSSENQIDKFLLSSSFVLGTITAIFIEMNTHLEKGILAFLVGMLLFMVSRDILPKDEEGSPLYLLLGMGIVFLVWLTLQFMII